MTGRFYRVWATATFLCIASFKLYAFGIGTGGGSPPPPEINLFSPTSDYAYNTSNWKLDIGFACSADIVTWTNSAGGSGVAVRGLNWSINGIVLKPGQNIVTLYASLGRANSTRTLAVNFIPPPPPKIKIISPKASQRLSNTIITVSGNATGRTDLKGVWYQNNTNGWQLATGTTNWSADIPLSSRPNTIQAYAMDMAGSLSHTSVVSFLHIIKSPLIVNTSEGGRVKPNDNGALLEIGETYKLTAIPEKGFKFACWTCQNSLQPSSIITNSQTIHFLMVSNMILEASFVDVAKPKVIIAKIKNQLKTTTTLVHVTGSASDNWKVDCVWYQLNNDEWNRATTTNSWKDWSAMVPLTSRTNYVKIYATDISGNISETNNLRVISTNVFKLRLAMTPGNPVTQNGLNFNLEAPSGVNGFIQISEDLVNWTTLTNFAGNDSTISFLDPTATNVSQRFYRAVAE